MPVKTFLSGFLKFYIDLFGFSCILLSIMSVSFYLVNSDLDLAFFPKTVKAKFEA